MNEKKIRSHLALMLAAEFHRCRTQKGKRHEMFDAENHKKTKQVFDEVMESLLNGKTAMDDFCLVPHEMMKSILGRIEVLEKDSANDGK